MSELKSQATKLPVTRHIETVCMVSIFCSTPYLWDACDITELYRLYAVELLPCLPSHSIKVKYAICSKSRDSSVGIATRLRDGRSGF
jgi:hypothetical protein